MAKIITVLADNSNVMKAFATERKAEALQLIEHYLRKKPSRVKENFFKKLKQRIEQDGFNYDVLRSELKQAGPHLPELFKHWEGAEASGAAECMQQLWLVATHQSLNSRALTAMVKQGVLPEVQFGHSVRLMQAEIQRILNFPLIYPESPVKQAVLTECVKIKEEAAAREVAVQRERAQRIRQAEADYQKAVLDKAIAIIHATPAGQLFFDPQGRVLVEVPALTAEELDEITGGDAAVLQALNVSPDKNTICDVDVLSLPQGEENFLRWAMLGAQPPIDVGLEPAIRQLITDHNTPLSSIIPLQKEMAFHLLHLARVLRLKIGTLERNIMDLPVEDAQDLDETNHAAAEWAHIMQEVNSQVNGLVRNAYACALQESLQNSAINLELLNQKLDAARAELAPQCQKLLVDACLKWLPPEPPVLTAVKALTKEDLTHTTATGKDYIRSDGRNHIVCRVVGTEKTSHHKTYGEKQAFRLISTMRYDAANGTVEPLAEEVSVRGRVPSIAVLDNTSKKTNKVVRFLKKIFKVFSHGESVVDVALKLKTSYSAISAQLGGYQGPMVYNLYTSLHSKFWDFFVDWGNHQRASAARILKGAHRFNAEQIAAGNPNSLWYVQNIPVNQHTNNLSYDAFDDATCEATLMADIALLSTFAQRAGCFPDNLGIKENYFQVHEAYKRFLQENSQGDIYFSDTMAAHLVKEQLTQFKQSVKTVALQPANPRNLVDLATKALLRLYSNNHHWNKQFGMLAQSLSVFIERASQEGCKSAIDRFEGVEGRVLMLESILPEELATNEVAQALTQFITAEQANPELLQKTVDTAYGKRLLYAQATSLEDNGGAAKLRASKSGKGCLKVTEVDTNIGESGYVAPWLSQKFTKAMQSHASGALEKLKKLFKARSSVVAYEGLPQAEIADGPAPASAPSLPHAQQGPAVFPPLFNAATSASFAAMHVAIRPPVPTSTAVSGGPVKERSAEEFGQEYNRMRFGELNS